VAVREKCGIKVPLDSRDKVVADLALAIRLYSRYRAPLLADGKEARRVVLEHYDWDKKGEEMNVCYLKATARKK
jgi:hypothetical protein